MARIAWFSWVASRKEASRCGDAVRGQKSVTSAYAACLIGARLLPVHIPPGESPSASYSDRYVARRSTECAGNPPLGFSDERGSHAKESQVCSNVRSRSWASHHCSFAAFLQLRFARRK